MFKGFFIRAANAGSGDQLLTADIKNRGLGCDPLLGLGRLEWTTAGDLTGATIELYADPDGLGYQTVQTGVDPTLGVSNFDVSGLTGFTSLDSTSFRINLIAATIDLQGSPKFDTPTYPCYP